MKYFAFLLITAFSYQLYAQTDSVGSSNSFLKKNKIFPVFRYIHSNMYFGGIHISNANITKGDTKYLFEPVFGKSSLYGRAGISKTIKLKESNIDFEPLLFVKTYPYFQNKILDYKTDFFKIRGQLKLNFNSDAKVEKSLALSHAFIQEQDALFVNQNLFNIVNSNLNVTRLNFTFSKRDSLVKWSNRLILERTQYDDILDEGKAFVKLSFERSKIWTLNNDKKFKLNLWASYFLINPNRNTNSFANDLVKGSLSLSSQGFTDYAYDGMFISRRPTASSFFNNQINANDGGMKFAATNTSQIGLSNNFAFSANMIYEVFYIKKIAKFGLFSEIGGYHAEGKVKTLYNNGLSIDLLDKLSFYVPLISSKEINENYRFNKINLLERINFSIHVPVNYFD